jgi:pancreatic triacylglycerol lipase
VKMRALILISLLAAATAYPLDHFYWQDENGHFHRESLKGTPKDIKAGASDVTLYLYSKTNPGGEIIHLGRAEGLPRAYNPNKQSIFIIHGWNNNHQSDVNRLIKDAVMASQDVNIFVVDWSGPANEDYLTAQNAVQPIGYAVGDYVKSLGQSASKFQFVGHSLGAHVSGCAGARIGGNANYIIGMDPAWPGFTMENTGVRLDPSDASFVQIIHTNGGLLGFPNSIGHADFYPNGGSEQPGCGSDPVGTCAHGRAYEFVAESFRSGGFTSRQCGSYDLFQTGACNANPSSPMGGFNPQKTARGDYYLNTNASPPYSKG